MKMVVSKSLNPAAESANGVQISEQVGAALGYQATPSAANFQDRRRYRLIAAGWIVVREKNGWRKSIPIFRRRAVPIRRLEMRS
ncbi:MAG: hypothetical protein WB495_22315 [Xanthobacteraceae bacterium]